ncbi:MAG: sulfite exporter TauE/SafE family protein [Thermoleophilia bacterium]|nr:sulfite exporter TauE/SafE family protein [Thermoleophilia bacterium]
MEAFEVIAIGFAAGVVAGLFGVGGGVVFVPALTLIFALPQAEAQATSLVAIVPVALVGSYRQHAYGNVAVRDGLLVGLCSLPGAIVASWLANNMPERALKILFAGLCLYVAFRMGKRALTPRVSRPASRAPARP